MPSHRGGDVLSCTGAFREFLRVLRGRRVRKLLCAVFVLCFVTCALFWAGVSHTLRHRYDCTERGSRIYLEQLCSDYRAGLVTGSLCKPLCDSGEIEFRECLGHGVKLHVLLAEWNGYKVILKSPATASSLSVAQAHVEAHFRDGTTVLTKKQFIEQANMTIYLDQSGSTYAPPTISALEEIFTECDIQQNGILEYSEALTCWQLVHTEELMFFLMLKENEAMLDIYGTCGALYAVQHATSQPFLGYKNRWEEGRDWTFRAKLALSLLELVESCENTPYGTLYLCDVQEANFGVAIRPDGSLVAKTIDTDICWFEKDLLRMLAMEKGKRPCVSNKDCAKVSCEVACNTANRTCSASLISNNLEALCRRIFLPRMTFHPALLNNPPEGSRQALQTVLSQCLKRREPHLPRDVLSELHSILTESISQNQ